jgi:nucleoside-diphosphate-sugar epimerase
VTTPVVVTGAAGFIGSHVTRALVEQGASVIATDVRTTLPEPVLSGLDTSRVSYVSGDLRREETLDDLVEAAGERAKVVHVAALLRYSEMAGALGQGAPSFPGALEVFDVNAMATWRLCSKFATAGRLARFVYVSTRSVFGSLQVDGDTIAETSPPSPIGIYGSSKTAAEFGVLAFRDVFGLDLVVARVTGVFGPWQGGVSWIGKAVDGVIAGTGYRTSTGGDDRYEFTYVKDTARGLVELVNAERLSYPIYHVSSGSIHSLGEVAQAFHAAEPDAVVEFGAGSQPGMRTRLPLGGSRIIEDLDFRPRWDLNAAIADYLAVERTGSYGAEVSEDPTAPGVPAPGRLAGEEA